MPYAQIKLNQNMFKEENTDNSQKNRKRKYHRKFHNFRTPQHSCRDGSRSKDKGPGGKRAKRNVYDIDGIGNEEAIEDDGTNNKNCKEYDNTSPNKIQSTDKKYTVKSSKQILMNAGQKSEFDSGMNNCQINQNQLNRDNRCGNIDLDTTYCTPVYGQIVSSRENHNQINEIQQKFTTNESTKPSGSFRKDWNSTNGKASQGWDEFSKRNLPPKTDADSKRQKSKTDKSDNKHSTNGKPHYDFFPVFDNKTTVNEDNTTNNTASGDITKEQSSEDKSKIIIDPMQKLVLHMTDNKICDNNTSALS